MARLRTAVRATGTLRLSHATRDNRAIEEARIIEAAEPAPRAAPSHQMLESTLRIEQKELGDPANLCNGLPLGVKRVNLAFSVANSTGVT